MAAIAFLIVLSWPEAVLRLLRFLSVGDRSRLSNRRTDSERTHHDRDTE
ncbi:hypothetical protein FHR70_004613 [Microvirga lupini]|uniref:Uncharacterized protein n=1 Tax=Microvirga lupini TaxID=420324 RepID=A0A7W4VRE6_9HYPH|nr:hypothetical protein [Microvirga lupini]MBB3021512.1 hypothetical protein [Microvirga lupini]